jgi:phospholipid-binding lipoprotein MlaA
MRHYVILVLFATLVGVFPAGKVGAAEDRAAAVVEFPAAAEAVVSAADAGAAETVPGQTAGEPQGEAADIETLHIADPIEPFNRGMFWLNDKLYFYLFKPIARGYRVVPEPARKSVSNFFSNLGTPVRFANALLQFKLADAGSELGRLVINSTLGIGGLFDPAKAWFDLDRKDEDLGQTFGRYGVGSGFYIVWPVLGPSNARDTVGMVGDFFMDPLHYVEMKPAERLGLTGLEKETDLSLDKDTYESVKQEALDPYLYVRNAYEQYRDGKIKK